MVMYQAIGVGKGHITVRENIYLARHIAFAPEQRIVAILTPRPKFLRIQMRMVMI